MGNKLLFIVLLICPAFCPAQVSDSLLLAKEVDSLIKASKFLTDLRVFERAIELNADAEKIAIQCCGNQSALYGKCCQNLGRILCVKEEFPAAEKWLMDAKDIYEKVFDRLTVDYGIVLNNLAEAKRQLRKYEAAEILYHQAFDVWSQVPDTSRQYYAMNTFNYANYQKELGNFDLAASLILEAKGIWEKSKKGKGLISYILSLNNLGVVYYSKGDYEEAEHYYLEAKQLLKSLPLKPNLQYAGCLNNMGALYREMGQYDKAQALYLEALSIWEKAPNQHFRDYAVCLSGLATVLYSKEQYDEAEKKYLDALAILEKKSGKEHPDYIGCLNNLAVLYDAAGNSSKADSLGNEAINILENASARNDIMYATSLNNQGKRCYQRGEYEKAEPLFLRAKTLREQTLGKEHLDYSASLSNLGLLYMEMGQMDKAKSMVAELSMVYQNLINKAALHLTERELDNYITSFALGQDITLSVLASSPGKTINGACYNNALFYKGFLLNTARQLTRLVSRDSLSMGKLAKLKGYRYLQNSQLLLPKSERDAQAVADLEEKANDLEKELKQRVPGYKEAQQKVTWKDVQQNLKPGDVAIEFIQYLVNPKFVDLPHYGALLVRPGYDAPQFVPLCQENEVAELIQGISGNAKRRISKLYLCSEEKNLYTLIWKPLLPYLTDAKTVFCAPIGLLHRINLGAIAINGGTCINEKYTLVTVSSTRVLVLPDSTIRSGMEAVLIGGIRYDFDSLAITKANEHVLNKNLHKNFPPDFGTNIRGDKLTYIPETLNEVLALQHSLQSAGWSTILDTGYHATEEKFRLIGQNNKSPRILNIATHGFFFPDHKETGLVQSNLSGIEYKFQKMVQPMIRSGLLFAGSKDAWEGNQHAPNQADGILIAYEISQMDLSNTELVVLSACETGLGEINGNEGVYGMQRAFKIAGAKYLILSLWEVQDNSTNAFIQEFYRQWVIDGLLIPEAFKTAQNNLKKEHPDSPYLWAGFVLLQ